MADGISTVDGGMALEPVPPPRLKKLARLAASKPPERKSVTWVCFLNKITGIFHRRGYHNVSGSK